MVFIEINIVYKRKNMTGSRLIQNKLRQILHQIKVAHIIYYIISTLYVYLSVFRHAQSVGKHVGRFLVLSFSGVLTDLRVGN